MFKKLAVSTALLASTLGVAFAPAASAADRDDWARRDRDRGRHERVEHRDREWREHERREVRDRYRYNDGYYDAYGYWHSYYR